MKRQIFIMGICFFLVLLFVYTGVSKLLSYPKFVEQMEQSPLFNKPAGWIVWIIPLSELVVATLLLIERTRPVGLLAATGLMVGFTGYVIYILRFNKWLPCTCGGIISAMNWLQHLYFNSITTVLCLIALILQFKTPSLLFKPRTKSLLYNKQR